MTPCIPSYPNSQCQGCERYSTRLPADPERRPNTVAIDASILPGAFLVCPMRHALPPAARAMWQVMEPRNLPRPQTAEKAMFDATQIGAGA